MDIATYGRQNKNEWSVLFWSGSFLNKRQQRLILTGKFYQQGKVNYTQDLMISEVRSHGTILEYFTQWHIDDLSTRHKFF